MTFTKENLDEKIAKFHIDFCEDVDSARYRELICDCVISDEDKLKYKNDTLQNGLVEGIDYIFDENGVYSLYKSNPRHVSFYEEVNYNLVNVTDFYGVKKYHFIDQNKLRNGDYLTSFFDLNSKEIPKLEFFDKEELEEYNFVKNVFKIENFDHKNLREKQKNEILKSNIILEL